MKYIILTAALALTAMSAFAGPNPQITGVTLGDGVTPLNGATIPRNVQQTVIAQANSDTTNVQISCVDTTSSCKTDESVPYSRNFTCVQAGQHQMTVTPWGSPYGNIMGPSVTSTFTVQ